MLVRELIERLQALSPEAQAAEVCVGQIGDSYLPDIRDVRVVTDENGTPIVVIEPELE